MHPRQHLSPSLHALAGRQEGVLTTAQLIDGGLSRAVVRRMAREWVNPADGLHLTSGATWLAAAHAGLLRGGSGSVLGEDAAAHLHDAVRDAPSRIAVWTEARRDGFTVGEWTVVYRRGTRNGIGSPPRTSVATSLVDLARVSSEDATIAAVARALAQNRTTTTRILAALAARQRTRHSAVIKELCGFAGNGIESALEWRFQSQVLLPHGLPVPEKQVRSVVGRGDALFRDALLAVELDGIRDHTECFKDMARDNARLIAEGTATLRYGWQSVTLEACAVAAQLADALTARGWDGERLACPRCPPAKAADLAA
ncbi:hypothetical protein [Tessaracoccus sp. G1721]